MTGLSLCLSPAPSLDWRVLGRSKQHITSGNSLETESHKEHAFNLLGPRSKPRSRVAKELLDAASHSIPLRSNVPQKKKQDESSISSVSQHALNLIFPVRE